MFENLQGKLERAFKVLKGQGNITEINVAETVKEIRRALLDADVNYKTAKAFTDSVKEKALGQHVLTAVSPGQLLTKVMHDELIQLMGSSASALNLTAKPIIILVAGLNGAGKTTFCGKLALNLKNQNKKKPLLVAADIYRPAAVEQLQVLGTQISVPVYASSDSKDPQVIAMEGIGKAKAEGYDVVILDTAGRLAVDEEMMNELVAMKLSTQPHEILLVVDAMTGQDAVSIAKTFNDRLSLTGVVLTKLDGDTRGGAALSIRSVVDKPIKFIGTGEKLEALEIFHPDRMASRILGMGDVVSLVERAQQEFDEEKAAALKKKIHKNTFDLNDLIEQIRAIKRMGKMKDLLGMIPGGAAAMKAEDLEAEEASLAKMEVIYSSMTPYERQHPEVLDKGRRIRIASGSGSHIEDVNQLMKTFWDLRKAMKQFSNPNIMAKMMQKMPGPFKQASK